MRFLIHKFPKVNFKLLIQEIIFWLGFGFILYGIGAFFQPIAFDLLDSIRNPILDQMIIFLTQVGLYIVLGIFLLVMIFRLWKNPKHHTQMMPAFFGVITTAILIYILKSFFALERPFRALGLTNLVEAQGFSFPSGHTATAFALLIPFWRYSKTLGVLWAFFALFMGISRVYEKVHFPMDVMGGIFVGGLIGALFSHPEMQKWIKILWSKNREFRRQSFHFIAGFLLVFLHWTGFLKLWQIGVLLIGGLFLALVSQYGSIKILTEILKLFDRPRDKKFPGRGAFYFLLGVFLTFLLFQNEPRIAYASILILSVGDSLNHLFASQFQRKIRFPWNKRKNIFGVFLGIFLGTFAAHFFVPFFPAFLGASVAIFLETVPFRIGKVYIDDNIFVPLIAGLVIKMSMFLV